MKKKVDEKSYYTIADIDKFYLENNEKKIYQELVYLEKRLGRKLTELEEYRILEIVDKYTPEDEKGNYLTDLLPFDYAWKIYEAEKETMWEKFRTSYF